MVAQIHLVLIKNYIIMGNTAVVPSAITKMTKSQLKWAFYRVPGLDPNTQTKEEMLKLIEPVLTPAVIDRVKNKEEY